MTWGLLARTRSDPDHTVPGEEKIFQREKKFSRVYNFVLKCGQKPQSRVVGTRCRALNHFSGSWGKLELFAFLFF